MTEESLQIVLRERKTWIQQKSLERLQKALLISVREHRVETAHWGDKVREKMEGKG